MKLSKKLLFLPCLALGLTAGSAYAGIEESLQNPDEHITVIQPTVPLAQWMPPARNRWQRFADWVEVKSCTFIPVASITAGIATGIAAACTSKNASLGQRLADGAVAGLANSALSAFSLTLWTFLIVVSAETD